MVILDLYQFSGMNLGFMLGEFGLSVCGIGF